MTPAIRALWLQERRKSLGASDVAQVLGASPYGGPWDVWGSKRLGIETPETVPMRVGSFLEPLVADMVAERWGDGAELEEVAQRHAEGAQRSPGFLPPDPSEIAPADPADIARALGIIRPAGDEWAHASPDRFVWLPGRDTPGVLQIKTTSSGDGWGPDGSEATPETVPPHYLLQVLWEMWCTAEYFAPFTPVPEAPVGWLAVLAYNTSLRIYPVRWDGPRMAEVIETCRAWWQRHIVGGEAPPIDGTKGCSEGLGWLVPEPKPGRIELPERAGEYVLAKQRWEAVADEAARNALLARNHLMAALGDSVQGLCNAGGKRKLVTRRGNYVTIRSVPDGMRPTGGDVDYSDAIPLGPFGEE